MIDKIFTTRYMMWVVEDPHSGYGVTIFPGFLIPVTPKALYWRLTLTSPFLDPTHPPLPGMRG